MRAAIHKLEMKTLVVWVACGLSAVAACTAEVDIAEWPRGAPAAGGGGGTSASGGGGEGGGAVPQTQGEIDCAAAIAEAQACMDLAAFESLGINLLAYQQSDGGPCGSCHRQGEACVWIGYNAEEMFAKWQELACMGEKLFECEFDDDGNLVNLTPGTAILDYPESANALGSPHPASSIPVELESDVLTFLTQTLDRWESGTCP